MFILKQKTLSVLFRSGLPYEFVPTVKKKAKIKNRYNQVPHLTRDTIWESDKNTRKHRIQESQEVSRFPAGDDKAARNRQDSIIKTNVKHKKDPQKKHRLGTDSKNHWRAYTCLRAPTSPLK